MFSIEKHTVKTDSYSWIKEMIRAQGEYKKLGSGAYGTVYGSKKSDIVYKVGDVDGNEGYLAYISVLSKQKKHNPFLPKIYGVRFIKDHRGNEYFVVAMERLAELPGRLEDAADFLADQLESSGTYETSGDRGARALGVKWVMPKDLKEAIKILKQAHKQADWADWDLHHGNFMVRGGKQVVVTDPLC